MEFRAEVPCQRLDGIPGGTSGIVDRRREADGESVGSGDWERLILATSRPTAKTPRPL
jgi:hypothetical protein